MSYCIICRGIKMKFLLLILILLTSVANASDFDHLKSGKYWSNPPSVLICEGTTIDKRVVSQAIQFWISQGYKIQTSVKTKDCSQKIKIGQIVIDYFSPGDNPEYFNAVAHSFNFKGDSMQRAYAKIYVRKSLQDEPDIYKHELGHALGLDDEYNNYDSVMTHEKVY